MITTPVTLSSHWTVSAARCALGTGRPVAPGCRRCLPDIVGLLVAGQHGACNGLLQVLSLPPQDLLEIIFQGLYDVTQKEDSPGQVLSLGEKKREARISSVLDDTPLGPHKH